MLVMIVESEVYVRAGMSLSSRPRTAMGGRHDPLDHPAPGSYALS
jgi:hypothetical protein